MKHSNKIIYIIFPALILLVFYSCQNETEFTAPVFNSESLLKNSEAINANILKKITGLYTLQEKAAQISDKVIIKCTKEYITLFAGKNIDYILLKGGIVDSEIVFEGYWRMAESLNSGLARLRIPKDSGGAELLRGKTTDIFISGWYMVDNHLREIVIKKSEDLKNDSLFYILAHRGGGRNSDYLSVSENSLPMIKLSEAFGANGIEIDVRLTKDKIPILYHDEELNSRLILGEFCVGPVENFPFSHIRTFCRLINGEEIPTLNEAFETILSETNLKMVWLDIKSPETMDKVVPIIKEYRQKAKLMKRNVSFVLGISTTELRDKFLSNPDYKNYESLCELTTDDIHLMDAGYWAPRWTLGSLISEVEQMHSEKRKVFVWTMDDRQFIKKYLAESGFDGILTNYPAILTYEYYIK
jgi:glycerophosphoryl diester phosphodiesterase